MTIKFCMISISWPQSPPPVLCSQELPLAPEGVFTRKISELCPTIQEFSEGVLRKLQKRYLESEGNATRWTKLAIVSLSLDHRVHCFDLIPRDPSKAYIVHVSRVKEGEDVLTQNLYEYHQGSLKFYLPTNTFSPRHVFDLSTGLISETIKGLTVDPDLIKTALKALFLDKEMMGVALTISEGTFIWLKGASPQLKE